MNLKTSSIVKTAIGVPLLSTLLLSGYFVKKNYDVQQKNKAEIIMASESAMPKIYSTLDSVLSNKEDICLPLNVSRCLTGGATNVINKDIKSKFKLRPDFDEISAFLEGVQFSYDPKIDYDKFVSVLKENKKLIKDDVVIAEMKAREWNKDNLIANILGFSLSMLFAPLYGIYFLSSASGDRKKYNTNKEENEEFTTAVKFLGTEEKNTLSKNKSYAYVQDEKVFFLKPSDDYVLSQNGFTCSGNILAKDVVRVDFSDHENKYYSYSYTYLPTAVLYANSGIDKIVDGANVSEVKTAKTQTTDSVSVFSKYVSSAKEKFPKVFSRAKNMKNALFKQTETSSFGGRFFEFDYQNLFEKHEKREYSSKTREMETVDTTYTFRPYGVDDKLKKIVSDYSATVSVNRLTQEDVLSKISNGVVRQKL
jgi:hypothetical protein